MTGAPQLLGSFLTGSVLSLVLPLALLIAVVSWGYISVRRRHPDGRKR